MALLYPLLTGEWRSPLAKSSRKGTESSVINRSGRDDHPQPDVPRSLLASPVPQDRPALRGS